MESKIGVALENLRKAILLEMNEMSEKHRKTIKELSDLQKHYSKLKESQSK